MLRITSAGTNRRAVRARDLGRGPRRVSRPLRVEVMEPKTLLATFLPGDVILGEDQNTVEWFRSNGTFVQTLDTSNVPNNVGQNGQEHEGLAFDASGNLYVGNFFAHSINKYDPSGRLLGTFGDTSSIPAGNTLESIVFNAAGDLFAGAPDGDRKVREFDPSGRLINVFSVASEDRGSDWLEIAPDQTTLDYTSEGKSVKTFNLNTMTQGPDLATNLPGDEAFQLRRISDGTILVADSDRVVRLNAQGQIIQTYTIPGERSLFAVNIDPSGTSFWTASLYGQTVYQVDLATGNILSQFRTHSGHGITGLVIKGEINQATAADLSVRPANGPVNVTVGGDLTVRYQVTNHGPSGDGLVTLTDALPAGFTFIGATAPASESGGQVTLRLGSLPAGGSRLVALVVRPTSAGAFLNAVHVAGTTADPNLSNNTADTTIDVIQTPGRPGTPAPAGAIPGPQVQSVQRYGFHHLRTVLVLTFETFNRGLDPAPAQNLNNYRLIPLDASLAPVPGGEALFAHPVLAMYRPADLAFKDMVTLFLDRPVSLRRPYELVVNGTAPNGLTNSLGVPLDGAGNGTPGTDYTAILRGFHTLSGRTLAARARTAPGVRSELGPPPFWDPTRTRPLLRNAIETRSARGLVVKPRT